MFYPNMMYYGGSPFHMAGPLFWIVFLIVLLVVVSKYAKGERRGRGSAVEILRERFAKGEISKEEFEERKRALEAE